MDVGERWKGERRRVGGGGGGCFDTILGIRLVRSGASKDREVENINTSSRLHTHSREYVGVGRVPSNSMEISFAF